MEVFAVVSLPDELYGCGLELHDLFLREEDAERRRQEMFEEGYDGVLVERRSVL
jgi:hypothetical protein